MLMNKFYSMLGLAKKAGYIISGETGCIEAIKKKKCSLLIIASDSSANTLDRFISLINKYNIRHISLGTKEELAQAIGKDLTAVIAITDENFSRVILNNTD